MSIARGQSGAAPRDPPVDPASMRLRNGSRVAVIGGGPAGSFSAYFLLQLAERTGIGLGVDVFEPRDFCSIGPRGCNMCGGIVSESLIHHLAAEGINLPASVIQRRLDSYMLHMDIGSVRIETPKREKRIAAVHRGSGPRDCESPMQSFDGHLLERATDRGARVISERVKDVVVRDGRPSLETASGSHEGYDLVVVGTGVNSPLLKTFEALGTGYRRPRTTKTSICDLPLGRWMIERYLGNAMHVFLLDIPRLKFGAIIPKSEYVTVCLLGDDLDQALLHRFLESQEVRRCMPPHWSAPDRHCQCSPKMYNGGAVSPYGDRIVFVGDSGTSRLYKDGIGAAYRTAKAMATTAVFHGVSRDSFQKFYRPACTAISRDNGLGRVVFGVTRWIQKNRPTRRAVWRMASKEQGRNHGKPRMGGVLWDTFTGSASYRSVLVRGAQPAFVGRLVWEGLAAALGRGEAASGRRKAMDLVTGVMGKKFHDGEVIYHQGERGECMYVVQEGEVEVVQRDGDKEFCLSVLKRGDVFGELAVFGDPVRSATVRAVGDVYVFTLEKDMLLQRLHEDPSVAYSLLQRMSQRIQKLETALVRTGSVSWDGLRLAPETGSEGKPQ